MRTTRKRYLADFKAKVALEAIRGDLTLAELAAKHGIHHTMIASWKKQAIEGMASTSSGAADMARASGEAEVEKLHAKIGQLVVALDLLANAFGRLASTVGGRWSTLLTSTCRSRLTVGCRRSVGQIGRA